MTFYLWQVLRDAYAELGQLQVSAATGGSTTTVVDTTLPGTGKDDDKVPGGGAAGETQEIGADCGGTR